MSRNPIAIVTSPIAKRGTPETTAGAIYAGDPGASNWTAVTDESGYPLNANDPFLLMPLRQAAVGNLDYTTLVAFGPGDGELERKLIQSTQSPRSQRKTEFVPVDISSPLIDRSIQTLRSEPNVSAPFAVHCDFETEREFLSEALSKRNEGLTLFTMLGGTIANLSSGEMNFLGWLRGVMESRDAVLLDIPTAGAAWTVAEEPRMHEASYSVAFRRFLALAIVRQGSRTSTPSERSVEKVFKEFEDRVSFLHRSDGEIGFEQISVVEKSSGRAVLQFRRYRFDRLVQSILSVGLTVPFASVSPHFPGEKFGMGVILAQKHPSEK